MSAPGVLRHLTARRLLLTAGPALSLALLWLASPLAGQSRPSAGEFPAYRAPRIDGHPDLNGIWQAFVTANWDLQDHEAQAGLHPELEGTRLGREHLAKLDLPRMEIEPPPRRGIGRASCRERV